jgi:hypothetical protein
MENNFVKEQEFSELSALDSDSTLFSETPYIKDGDVTAVHILNFAKKILAVLSIIFVMSALFEFYSPNNAIFETCKVTIPSLATLVIGYYFGSTKQ